MFGIIGGSGFEKFDDFETIELLSRETPYGLASSGLKKVKVDGVEALFLSRHGEHHEQLPSEINYRANIFALKAHGAKSIISFSAVGSLKEAYAPGHMVIPFQYIDRTKGIRKSTFCGDGVVGHVSLAHPICEHAANGTRALAEKMDFKIHYGGTYICVEGPTFSTFAESISYRKLDADIVGMTNYPEYALAREAGVAYLPCCFITDYDCWNTDIPHVTLEEVLRVMRQNNAKGFAFLRSVLKSEKQLLADCTCDKSGLKFGLMSPPETLHSVLR
jgi:5'-methylthioadenosine phosphorylase